MSTELYTLNFLVGNAFTTRNVHTCFTYIYIHHKKLFQKPCVFIQQQVSNAFIQINMCKIAKLKVSTFIYKFTIICIIHMFLLLHITTFIRIISGY